MNKAAAIAIGLSVAVLAGAVYFFMQGHGDADKSLELAVSAGNCGITTPNADKNVAVGKGKKVTWSVHNGCTSDQLVLVGNFRPGADGGGIMDCKAGVIESTWPFKNLDQSARAVYIPAGETQSLTLKEAKNETGSKLTFYFDICMGGKKVDPELVIDP